MAPTALQPLDEDFQSVMCVVAHPDDIEYGTSAAVDRWVKQGKTVTYLLASRGEAGIDSMHPEEAGPVREAEERALQAFIDAFAPLLCDGDWLAIGRGGQPVVVESITVLPGNPNNSFKDNACDDDWTLTLVSDLIVRGAHLGFLDNLDIDQLCDLAAIKKQDDWKVKLAVAETEPVHGFNAVSGLQRAPALALRRGSCWRITGTGSAALAKRLAEKAALGERTREGLGRFLIDAQPIKRLNKPESTTAEAVSNRTEYLLSLAQELSRQIAEKNGPSLSQLQWLRGRALAVSDDEQLNELLEEIETAPVRRPQGGARWGAFPTRELKDKLKQIDNTDKARALIEKRQLISHLVQWRAPFEKEKRG